MHSTYFKQTCSWQRRAGIGGDGRPTHGEAVVLPCFRVDRIQLVRDRTGAQVVSQTEIRAGTPIGLDDLVDTRAVIAVGVGRGLFGKVDFYKAYLA
jgi:hypothetical protein